MDLSATTATPPPFPAASTSDTAVTPRAKATLQMCMLGGRGAGKTCFLGGLAVLDRSAGWHLRADTQSTNRLDDIVITLIERGGWLAPTRDTERYHITVSFGGQSISFDTFDYPGVYIQTAIRNLNRDVEPDLLAHYLASEILLVFLDPDEDLTDVPVLAALEDSLKHRFMDHNQKQPALAVVLTKADRHGLRSASQAATFLREQCPGFMNKIKGLAGKVSVFPLSAVGTVDENGRPTPEAKPTGYEPLFRWMIAQQKSRHRKRWGAWTIVGMLFLLGVLLTWRASDAMEFLATRDTLRDAAVPASERLDRSREYAGWFTAFVNPERARVANDELARLQSAAQSATDDNAARRVVEEARMMAIRAPASVREPLVAVSRSALDRAAKMSIEQVRAAKANNERNWQEQAQLFIDRYSDTPLAVTAREWLIADLPQAQRDARLPVARVEIDGFASCQYKADAIRRYLKEFGNKHTPTERRRIERAAELGELFARKRDWSVNLVSAGEFKHPRRMGVRIYYPDNDFVGVDSPVPVQRLSIADDYTGVDWRPGTPLRVAIYGDEGWIPAIRRDTLAASITLEGPFAILDLVGGEGLWLESDRRWRDDFTGIPIVRFRAQRGIDADDAAIAREYLSPGLRWK